MRIFLHHIPKTGAGSVDMKLRDIYNYKAVYSRIRISRDQEPHDKITFYSSHDSYRNMTGNLRPDDFWFTIIRHPVAVFHSAYFYFGQSAKRSDNHIDPLFEKLRFEDYIDYRLISPAPWWNHWLNLDYNAFSFVGVLEEMDKTYSCLNNHLGLSLKNDLVWNSTKEHMKGSADYKRQYDLSYRRDDLEKMLAPLIVKYEECKQRLFKEYQSLEIS